MILTTSAMAHAFAPITPRICLFRMRSVLRRCLAKYEHCGILRASHALAYTLTDKSVVVDFDLSSCSMSAEKQRNKYSDFPN